MSTFVWRVELLGGLRVFPPYVAAPLTRFSTVKAAALLAFLVSHPHQTHTREALADRFWPDAAPDAGRVSLRAALSALRRELEAAAGGGEAGEAATKAFLRSDRQQVEACVGSFTVDTVLFEAAVRRGDTEAARALYRGELLPGVYDDWACRLRDHLAGLAEGFPQAAPAPLAFGVPPILTRGFGRDRDRDAVWSLLATGDANGSGDAALLASPRRLVTLTGPGGVGKTRLLADLCRAVSANSGAPAPFAGGVVFAFLADAREASEIAPRIASALSLPDPPPSDDPFDALCRNLAARDAPLLLALDNFEQLLDAQGDAVVAALLARAPLVSVVVTSRRRLGIEGEREWTIAPLPSGDAVRLFRDRAQNARPDFPADADTDTAVCSLVNALDGLPLAIELVAARAGSLTVAQMQEGLAQNFALVSAAAATANGEREARHQSLDAAIAWSVALLPASLARFWTTLSVFRGAISVAAAARVADVDPADAAEMLVRLRERSLLLAEDAPGGKERRYRLLETLRAFAADRASHETVPAENGETVTVARRSAARHLAYFHDFVVEAGKSSAEFDAVEADFPNLRAALDYGESDVATDAERAQLFRFGGALWNYWRERGGLREGRARVDSLLAATADLAPGSSLAEGALAHQRYILRRAAGGLALRMNDVESARAHFEMARPLTRASDDPTDAADLSMRFALLAVREGDMPAAFQYGRETLALSRSLQYEPLIKSTLLNLANTATYLGDYQAARGYYDEAISLRRAEGESSILASALHSSGLSLFHQGDWEGATRACREALEMRFRLHTAEIEDCLELFAMCAVQKGDYERAARLAGAASALRETSGAQATDADAATYEAALAPSRHALGEIAFAQAFATGEALPEAAAVALALAF